MMEELGLPTRIGDYEVVRRIGYGGTGEVFEVLAHGKSGFEQRVCLKRLYSHHSHDPGARARFEREARIAASLRHKNIVGLLDYSFEGRPYLVFDFIDGVNLADLSEHKRLSPEQVMLIGAEVASALHYAHTYVSGDVCGVLHRDVSPANILVSRQGDVKLADFGMAKVQTGMSLTVSRQVSGTFPYLPPEVFDQRGVDARCDLYSLGVVLYELVAARRPFSGETDYALMFAITEGDYEPLPVADSRYPEAFISLIHKMLHHDREKRPASAEEVVVAMHSLGALRKERRRLGESAGMAAEQRSGGSAPPEVLETRNPGETEALPLPKRRGRARKGPIRWLLFGFASILGVVAALAFFSSSKPIESPPGAFGDPVSLSEEPEKGLAPSSAPNLELITEPSAETKDLLERFDELYPATPTVRRGTLKVYATPWGEVWINDEHQGRGPVQKRLTPGLYTVAIGKDRPIEKRRVRVRAGRVTEVTLSLPVTRE